MKRRILKKYLKKHSSFELYDDTNLRPLIRYHNSKKGGRLNYKESRRFFNREDIKETIGIFINIFGKDKVLHDRLIWKSKKSDFIKVGVYCYYYVEKERQNGFDFLCFDILFNYKRKPNYHLSNEFVQFRFPRYSFLEVNEKFPLEKLRFTEEELRELLVLEKEKYYKVHENINQ